MSTCAYLRAWPVFAWSRKAPTDDLPSCESGVTALQIIARNLEPALRWAGEHQAQLIASNGEAAVHAFEFRLHQLQFLHCLQTSGGGLMAQSAALQLNSPHAYLMPQ